MRDMKSGIRIYTNHNFCGNKWENWHGRIAKLHDLLNKSFLASKGLKIEKRWMRRALLYSERAA